MSRSKRMLEDLDHDIRDHIEQETQDNIDRGMSPEEARYAALRKFGNVTRIKEDAREVWTIAWLEQLLQDVRFGLRMLRNSPSFTVVAIVTLAVAIGANVMVFGVMDALILRPLNVPHAEGLYAIGIGSDQSASQSYQSYSNYLDLRDRNRSFDEVAGFDISPAGLDAGDETSRVWLYEVTGNYFDVLGIQPYLGRFFHASDERGPNSAPYIVLTYAYWHSRFQDDRGVVGRTVQLNKHPFTIIGVAPPKFRGTILFFNADFFAPIIDQEQVDGWSGLNDRASRWMLGTIGRLKDGVTPAQATADLNSIGAYLEKTYPKDDSKMTFALARPTLVGDFMRRSVGAFVAGLMLLAGLILLAACTNLGSLFAARAADRSREVALRLALGAGRIRILRQLFTEATLISLMGGAAGLWGSVLLLRWLSAWQPFPQFPINVPLNPDAKVYGIALLLALASGFLFGAVPVRQVLRTDPYQIVKAGPEGADRRRITVRDLLLAVQIALCGVLVTSSMVAVRGLARSMYSSLGFDPHNAMLVETDPHMAGYQGEAVPAVQKRMIDTLQTISGVTLVGLVSSPPLHMGWDVWSLFTDETTDLRPSNVAAEAITFHVSPEYFPAAGTTLLAGRDFTWRDDQKAPRVAVINLEFARKVFGSAADAMGRYFKKRDGTRMQVVGIIEDGKYTANIAEDPQPALFLPILQAPYGDTWLVIRSKRDPQQLAAAIKGKFRDLDPGLPAFIQTWDEEMNGALFPSRVATVSLGALGAMGAILSMTGIFGVAAYAVSKRKRELGIRMALGAQRGEVLQAALSRPFKLLVFGSAAGMFLGILASRVLASIVYQATPRDPLVLAGVVLVMALLGLLATWIPAQRALSIEPLMLLREE